jgi:hypothetical protein
MTSTVDMFLKCTKPSGTAFFTYGRFQPGHTGHQIMIETLLEKAAAANNSNIFVFVSPSGGPEEKKINKNPLPPELKVLLLQHQYAGAPIHFINMEDAKAVGINGSAKGSRKLLANCYENAVFVRGEDLDEAGKPITLEESFGWLNNPDFPIAFEGVERPKKAMSATMVRDAALRDDEPSKKFFLSQIMFGNVSLELANIIWDTIRSKHKGGGRTRRKRTKRKRTKRTRRKRTRRKRTKRTKRKRTKSKRTKRTKSKRTKSKRTKRTKQCRFH